MNDIDQLIADFKKTKWESKPFERMTDIVADHPERVRSFVEKIVSELPKGGTFLDASLSLLPESEWDSVVAHALEAFEADPRNEAAESIIAYASLQSPKSLHKHLNRLLLRPPSKDSYYASWPWRESKDLHAATLKQAVLNAASSDEKLAAWERALQTRDGPVLLQFLELVDELDMNDKRREMGLPESITLNDYLRIVGYEHVGGQLRRLAPETAFHIVFPPGYMEETRSWLKPLQHPTWGAKLGDVFCEAQFGGAGAGTCGHCGGILHSLLAFKSMPRLLDVSMSRLLLQTCLSCLGWTGSPLFYQHDVNGTPRPIKTPDELTAPEFPAEPLAPCVVSIARTSRRWFWQDWGLSNSRENLNRVGGEPCWIQDPQYPECPQCAQTMKFLMQLDSNIPTSDGGDWLWGSGGIGYGFWCEPCRVSAFLWQCT